MTDETPDLAALRWRLVAEHRLDPADVELLSGADEPMLRKQARRLGERSAEAKQPPSPHYTLGARNGDDRRAAT